MSTQIEMNLQNNIINNLNQLTQLRNQQASIQNNQRTNNNSYREENIHIIREIGLLFFCIGVLQVMILVYIESQQMSHFIPLYLFGIFSLYKLIRFIRLSINEGYNVHKFSILEHFLACFSVVGVCMYFEYKAYYFSYICIPLFISTALKLETSKFEKRFSKDLTYFYNITSFIVSAIIWVQILQIGLKLDFVITLNWIELLWPFWTTLVVLVLIATAFLYLAIRQSIDYLQNESTQKHFQGYFALFFIFSFFATSLFLTSLQVLEYLEEDELQTDNMTCIMIYCLISTAIMSIIIYGFQNLIEKSLVKALLFDSTNQNSNADVIRALQNILRHQRQDFIKNPEKNGQEIKKLQMSVQDQIYLQKQSATFYQIIQQFNDKNTPLNNFQKEQSPVACQASKKYRRIQRKSHTFSELGEELKRLSSLENQSPQNKLKTLSEESENDGNKIQHNGERTDMHNIHPKIPQQQLSCLDEIITMETCRKQHEQDIMLDIHDILCENNSSNFKKVESACIIKDKPKNTSFYVLNKQEENNDMNMPTCLVCFDKNPDSVFKDCGHGGKYYQYCFNNLINYFQHKYKGICYDCALSMFNKTSECHLCRKKITEVLQIDNQNINQDKTLLKVISKTIKYQKQQ